MSNSQSQRRGLSRRGFLGLSAAVGGGLLIPSLAACGTGPATAQGPVSVPTGPNAFKGVTVRVAVGSFMSTGVSMFKDAWEAQTGGKLQIVEIPFGDLYSKLFQAFSSRVDAYDVVVGSSDWVSGFAKSGFIKSLEPYISKYKDNWDSILPPIQKLSYYNNQRYTVPLDGDVFIMYYRKDAFENPTAQQRFQTEKGRPLTVPKTWAEYVECAHFFTGWDWAGNGKPCYGVLEALKPHDVGPYVLAAHAAAYTAHPDHHGSMFFDPDTMEPQVSNPGWVQALTDWKALLAAGPSQMVTYGGGDQRGNFVAGNYALAIDWPDIGILAQDKTQSIVSDKLGYAMTPGSNRVWNLKSKKWDNFPDASLAPYMGWGGWHASVAATSPQVAAAWHFANFIDTTDNAKKAVTTPGTARGPYRNDEFDPAIWRNSAVAFAQPEDYLNAQKQGFTHPNVQYDLRIPQAGRYFDALDSAAQLALSGQSSPQQALTQCAQQWKTITEQIGADSQKKLYNDLVAGD